MKTNVIVGAGQAGACAAIAMRGSGFTGRIVLIGDEPALPYERPPLSKAVLLQGPGTSAPQIYSEAHYREHRIEPLFGRAVVGADAANRSVELSDGTVIHFDNLLLATGGRLRELAIPGKEHLLGLRTEADAHAIHHGLTLGAHIVCIGAGVIGLEVAAAAIAKGCSVTVVEAGSSAMSRSLCETVRRLIERHHVKAGVTFRFGTSPIAVEPAPNGTKRLLLDDGSAIPADMIVAGIGIQRNTELAELLGVEVDNGIVVDEFGQASKAGIHAGGDVAAFWHPGVKRRLRLESWRHAQNHGIAVAKAICGAGAPYADVPWFWTDQYDLHVQVYGLPREAARNLYGSGEKPGSLMAYHLDAEDRVVGATAVNAPRSARSAQALIRDKSPLPAAISAELGTSLPHALEA